MRLVFKGPPVVKERHRDLKPLKVCPFCGRYLPRRKKGKYNPSEDAEHALGWEAKSQKPRGMIWPLKADLSVEMIFRPDRTEVLVEECKNERPKAIRGDLTNIAKAFEDALNRIVWTDDKRIVELKLGFGNLRRD